MPRLLEENTMLNAKVKQQDKELEVVKWYIEILEEGVDTKQLAQEYQKLKKDHRQLEKSSSKQISMLTKENTQLAQSL